jgi:hypothetical protein
VGHRHPSVSFHVLTLVMTALIAWPWNVVLSAAESAQVAGQQTFVSVQAQQSAGGHRLLRCGWWNRQSCSVIAPDYDRDEEEGDDGGPLSVLAAPAAVLVLASTHGPGSALKSLVLPVWIPPREHLCPLRC